MTVAARDGSSAGGPSTRAVHGGEARRKLGDALTDPIVTVFRPVTAVVWA